MDGRKSQWNTVKTVVLMLQVPALTLTSPHPQQCLCVITLSALLTRCRCCSASQNVIPAEVSLVCVVKPDEFWDKKVTHFCFWKEKDRLGFEVSE